MKDIMLKVWALLMTVFLWLVTGCRTLGALVGMVLASFKDMVSDKIQKIAVGQSILLRHLSWFRLPFEIGEYATDKACRCIRSMSFGSSRWIHQRFTNISVLMVTMIMGHACITNQIYGAGLTTYVGDKVLGSVVDWAVGNGADWAVDLLGGDEFLLDIFTAGAAITSKGVDWYRKVLDENDEWVIKSKVRVRCSNPKNSTEYVDVEFKKIENGIELGPDEYTSSQAVNALSNLNIDYNYWYYDVEVKDWGGAQGLNWTNDWRTVERALAIWWLGGEEDIPDQYAMGDKLQEYLNQYISGDPNDNAPGAEWSRATGRLVQVRDKFRWDEYAVREAKVWSGSTLTLRSASTDIKETISVCSRGNHAVLIQKNRSIFQMAGCRQRNMWKNKICSMYNIR